MPTLATLTPTPNAKSIGTPLDVPPVDCDEWETPIQQPKDPTNEQLIVGSSPGIHRSQTRVQSPMVGDEGDQERSEEQKKKYPRRRNVRKPSRYGFTTDE